MDPEAAALAGYGRAEAAPLHTAEDGGPPADRQLAHGLHLGHDADAGVGAITARDQEDASVSSMRGIDGGAGVVAVEGQGDDRAREHHATRDGHEGEDHLLVRGGVGRCHTGEGTDRGCDYNLTRPGVARVTLRFPAGAREGESILPGGTAGEELPVGHDELRWLNPKAPRNLPARP